MATYSDILRKKNEAAGLRTRAERARGLAESYNKFTVGGGNVQGMGGVTSPTPQALDWGSIVSKGLGSYEASKSEKQASDLEKEAEDLNEQFMRETLGGDEQATKLYSMVQAGIPGAEQALSDHISPKKEAMGAFLQYFQSGMADPAMASEIAPRFGISPELAGRAADYAQRKMFEKGEIEHGRELELQGARNQGRLIGRTGAVGAGLTPGEKQIRAKMMAEADKELNAIGTSDTKFQEVLTAVEGDNTFGAGSKLSEFLAESPNRVMAGVGKSMQSTGNLMLKEYVTGESLRRMAMLGGNDSNEELNRITGSLPSAMNDKQAALTMLNNLHRWEKTTRLALKLRRDDIQAGTWFGRQPSKDDYYRQARSMIESGQEGNPQPVQSGPLQGIPTEQMDIEGMLDELGIPQ